MSVLGAMLRNATGSKKSERLSHTQMKSRLMAKLNLLCPVVVADWILADWFSAAHGHPEASQLPKSTTPPLPACGPRPFNAITAQVRDSRNGTGEEWHRVAPQIHKLRWVAVQKNRCFFHCFHVPVYG